MTCFKHLPECENRLFCLERLVVGELDYVWDWGEKRLVDVYLRVCVDRVVADV